MLVMYTLNTTVSAKLPDSSTIKLMDIWILYGLFTHFLIVIILVLIEHLPSKPTLIHVEDCTSQIIKRTQKEKSMKDTRAVPGGWPQGHGPPKSPNILKVIGLPGDLTPEPRQYAALPNRKSWNRQCPYPLRCQLKSLKNSLTC